MKIFHIEFAKVGLGASGGETGMIEIIKYLKSKKIENVLLTTDNGKETYQKLGLLEDEYLKYICINSYAVEKRVHAFISYVLRVFQAANIVKTIYPANEDAFICHSDFFPNSIPMYLLARKNENTKLIYFFHLLCPDLFKGYKGHFTNKFYFPTANVVHYKLNQWLFKCLARKRGVLVTVNDYYRNILEKKYPYNKIYVMKSVGGVKVEPGSLKKEYDLVWMGRFHEQKGLFEMLDIVRLIKQKDKGIKVVVVGDSSEKFKNRFLDILSKLGLQENVNCAGFVPNDEKNDILKKSKVFLMTSLYESFGSVNLEAMTCGVPVIAYNLPVFDIFKKGMIRVPILDNARFAEETLHLLRDDTYYSRISQDALSTASNYSSEKTGEEIYNLIVYK